MAFTHEIVTIDQPVTTAYTVLATMLLRGQTSMVGFQLTNESGDALNDCKVELQYADGSDWMPYLGATDWDAVSDSVLLVSATGPHELAATEKSQAVFRARAVARARISVKSVGASVVSCYAHTGAE